MRQLALAFVLLALGGAAGAEPLDRSWLIFGEGQWFLSGRDPSVVRQADPAGVTSAVVPSLDATGGVWRCIVEPAPQAAAAGFWFGAAPDLTRGYLLTLGGNPGTGGVALRDAAGGVLWEDRYAPWSAYTPSVLEGIVEPGRVRVQVFRPDGKTLIAQSDWIAVPDEDGPVGRAMALHADHAIARFYRWIRTAEALSPIVPDSPSRMRLVDGPESPWSILGGGEWGWTTPEKRVLRQSRAVERTTALSAVPTGPEGAWRCRVTVEPGAGGAGMLILTDKDLTRGYSLWLGGEFGNGSLMVYRQPGEALWSGDPGVWHYDTEYVIDAAVSDGALQVRLLAADGATVLSESPAIPLTDAEKAGPGLTAFQTWLGCARFTDFSDATRVEAPAPAAPQATDLGSGWRVVAGDWSWADDTHTTLRSGAGDAAAVNTASRGDRMAFRARVIAAPECNAMSLLFQVDPELQEGFECRLAADGVCLRTLDGRTLWQDAQFTWEHGKAYVFEGTVLTDRVRIAVLDDTGTVLLKSDDCYVSSANNTREGFLGVRAQGGPVEVRDWSARPAE